MRTSLQEAALGPNVRHVAAAEGCARTFGRKGLTLERFRCRYIKAPTRPTK